MAALRKNVQVVELKKRSLVPAKWEESVRVIGMSECREAARSLSHSFAADDLSQYLLNSDDMADVSAEDKWRLHVDIMTYFVAATLAQRRRHHHRPGLRGRGALVGPRPWR